MKGIYISGRIHGDGDVSFKMTLEPRYWEVFLGKSPRCRGIEYQKRSTNLIIEKKLSKWNQLVLTWVMERLILPLTLSKNAIELTECDKDQFSTNHTLC